ncbi:hypothetical protein Tdes44962_MAKER06661 [Teratosphaeria destructans]|uniref:Uncharacterized protein n=1 Tax=Teratosphaeria destructans TaxID=418781 RepID=A0A9W7W775_9PEZI|nr:hypothetical protein Tdes44962_MAKER06661 [Teratosphaeria destructans]
MLMFHSIDWLHKGLRSANVLFLPCGPTDEAWVMPSSRALSMPEDLSLIAPLRGPIRWSEHVARSQIAWDLRRRRAMNDPMASMASASFYSCSHTRSQSSGSLGSSRKPMDCQILDESGQQQVAGAELEDENVVR